jgi:hypothetical protein
VNEFVRYVTLVADRAHAIRTVGQNLCWSPTPSIAVYHVQNHPADGSVRSLRFSPQPRFGLEGKTDPQLGNMVHALWCHLLFHTVHTTIPAGIVKRFVRGPGQLMLRNLHHFA